MMFPIIGCSLIKTYRRSKSGCRTWSDVSKKPVILGIETSCDDTGAALVNSDGTIFGEHLISQREAVLRHGGILPLIAKELHHENIHSVVDQTFKKANMTVNDIDAIAVTIKPGLAMSLMVGIEYAKELSRKYKKFLIPIHHMKAHALTIRLCDEVILLNLSGGHCILAVAHSVDKFSILGQSLDDAPGEAFDKIARRLKAHTIPKYRNLSGGAVIEELAKSGNPLAFQFTEPLQRNRDCHFSFSGMKTQAIRFIEKEEKKFDTEPDEIIQSINDFCASFQLAISLHLCRRLQRAIEYMDVHSFLLEDNLQLVVSGGTACNKYIRRAFEVVCFEKGYTLHIPPAKYCTDNGIMIAWNGVEKYMNNIHLYPHDKTNDIKGEPRSPIGEDLSESVLKTNIKCTWIKVAKKLTENKITTNEM